MGPQTRAAFIYIGGPFPASETRVLLGQLAARAPAASLYKGEMLNCRLQSLCSADAAVDRSDARGGQTGEFDVRCCALLVFFVRADSGIVDSFSEGRLVIIFSCGAEWCVMYFWDR